MPGFDPTDGLCAPDLAAVTGRVRQGPVLVVGLGRSGRAAVALLGARGAEVRAYDAAARPAAAPAVPTFSGPDVPPEALAGVALVVLSPGVPPAPVVAAVGAHAPGARVTGTFTLGIAALLDESPDADLFLVTGTNGKSTTATILAALLEADGRAVFAGGNLGPPLCAHLAGDTRARAYVLEASSFQLETYPGAPARAAVITNVTPDHLDRYPGVDAYAATKAAVFRGMDAGRPAVLGAPVPEAAAPPPPPGLRVIRAYEASFDPGGAIVLPGAPPVDAGGFPLAGAHNRRNAACALAVALDADVPPDACARGLAAVRPLPHRCAFVAALDGVAFYDDSKATNVASAVATLDGLARPFVLVAGGRAKPGDDPTPLVDLVAREGRGAVLLGESAARLAALLGRHVPVSVVDTMDEAVAAARALAQPGDAVVLAPAAASFDRYENFEARGRDFARAVRTAYPSAT